jgi:hypothetical protein
MPVEVVDGCDQLEPGPRDRLVVDLGPARPSGDALQTRAHPVQPVGAAVPLRQRPCDLQM